MGRLANLGLIFTSPTTVARKVVEDPHWVIPLVVVLVIGFIFAFFTFEYRVELERELRGEAIKERVPDADLDEIFAVTAAKRLLGAVRDTVGVGVGILIVAAVLKGAAALGGGGVGFRRLFAFVAYSSVIPALGSLIKLPLVHAKGSLDIRTSLAVLVPSGDLLSPLTVLLNSFDIFQVWQVVALCFGFSVLSGFSIKKSSIIVVGLWVVWLAIQVGGIALLRGLAGGS